MAFACSVPNHYLNQCCFIANWTLSKATWFSEIWIQIQNMSCRIYICNCCFEMVIILSRQRWFAQITPGSFFQTSFFSVCLLKNKLFHKSSGILQNLLMKNSLPNKNTCTYLYETLRKYIYIYIHTINLSIWYYAGFVLTRFGTNPVL